MLPIATQNDLGAIKVGAGLQAGDDGTLSVAGEGDAGNALSMIVTYGSPAVDSTIPHWLPTNLVTVYGPPSMPLMITATNGATFIGNDPPRRASARLRFHCPSKRASAWRRSSPRPS